MGAFGYGPFDNDEGSNILNNAWLKARKQISRLVESSVVPCGYDYENDVRAAAQLYLDLFKYYKHLLVYENEVNLLKQIKAQLESFLYDSSYIDTWVSERAIKASLNKQIGLIDSLLKAARAKQRKLGKKK